MGSLVVACMWDLVPWPGIEPGTPALGAWSLIHCTTREVPCFSVFNWSIVDLVCCVSFRCTAKWFSYTYIYIYFFQILFPYRLLQNIEYSSLCYTPYWLSVLYIYSHMCIYFFQILFPYRLLQNIEYSTLCYTVGPCWLSILDTVFKTSFCY